MRSDAHPKSATPKTVAWGLLRREGGAGSACEIGRHRWEIQTLITNSPKRLEDAGVPPDQVEQSLRNIYDPINGVQAKDKGPAGTFSQDRSSSKAPKSATCRSQNSGHQAGDSVRVQCLRRGRGYLLDDLPLFQIKIIPLDEKRMVAKFAPGIEIPLHPFFRQHGRRAAGKRRPLHSAPPWIMGGNLDNKDLVAGSTLYLPVHRTGALFEVATATPDRATAKWTSPPSKLRSSEPFNLWCASLPRQARTCT